MTHYTRYCTCYCAPDDRYTLAKVQLRTWTMEILNTEVHRPEVGLGAHFSS